MTTPRKWVTEPDNYVCTLSEEVQEIAREELREDTHSRESALESMREWIKQNPKIKNCRMDAKFLLRFLRFKKFSVEQAKEALERYVLLRQTFGVAFNCLDITIPMMEELTNLGYMFACPKRDSKGRRVIVARPGVFDLNKFTNGDMCRIHGIVYETLMEDEENQVRGFVHFADGSGVGFAYLTLFTIREAVRIVKNGEKTLPMRHKEVHGFNIHPSMKFALDWGMSLISEKIKSRVRLYSNIEEVLEAGYVEKEVLPKEYGGTMPMSEMIELWKEELRQSHPILMSHDEMAVNEELFTRREKEGAVSALRRQGVSCGAEKDSLCGITGNFRKLEVD
ncbi:alpha-tocopherol transfer protein-like [Anthonomus grandis grandis]|uniref:alpha-tocopherol transfer protein-like n=1 Tax=Anthonomus grandis grandis TaxID=2921223 RepID=UPI0021655312|nr:alpha-tocopherol transfer protein-like [Anthonomus grandis grandis]XP_050316053.1 alpha-tocopherol transfer protein-like [Anthonomus grandis grandis]XP_050316054.1 alpha-tocopherol transfer protein-like [Anthonomus grandis grandis]XP_050316055.1 alpha-tocopherol transfer protein-like [Anthonomus grandis grandis]